MTGPAANPDATPGVVLLRTVERCACSHADELHHPAGVCVVTLPAWPEEELPAWRCPCRQFTPVPAEVWRWHAPTQTWTAVAS